MANGLLVLGRTTQSRFGNFHKACEPLWEGEVVGVIQAAERWQWRVVLLRLVVTNKGNLHSRSDPCHPTLAC